MVAWVRRKVCIADYVCLKCLNPGVVYTPAHNDSWKIVVDSKENKKKTKFTCTAVRCTINCWICSNHNHKLANKVLLKGIRNTMKAKGFNMGFAAGMLKKVRKSVRPADTEINPEKSVPYFWGKKLMSEGKMKTKVWSYGGNSGSEDGVWKETGDKVTENPKIFKFKTKSQCY
jgi:hypothetical protein